MRDRPQSLVGGALGQLSGVMSESFLRAVAVRSSDALAAAQAGSPIVVVMIRRAKYNFKYKRRLSLIHI